MPLTRRQVVKVLLSSGALAGVGTDILDAATLETPDVVKPVFDTDAARENLRGALALVAREEALRGGYSADAAQKLFLQRLPAGSEYKIFNKGNKTSALVLNERAQNRITVSLNTTDALSAYLNRFEFWSDPRPLGGEVHKGFYTSILERQQNGQRLVDDIRLTVADYAKDATGQVDVHLTGFSRGGAMAVATAAQWMADGFPPADSNIKLSSIYTFASPPLGDDVFNARFAEEAKKRDLKVWRVLGAGDPVPKAMTADTWYPFFGKPYGHVGTPVYLIPSENRREANYLVDPSKKDLLEAMRQLKKPVTHDQSVYAELLGAPDAKMAPLPPRREDRPQPTAHPTSQPR